MIRPPSDSSPEPKQRLPPQGLGQRKNTPTKTKRLPWYRHTAWFIPLAACVVFAVLIVGGLAVRQVIILIQRAVPAEVGDEATGQNGDAAVPVVGGESAMIDEPLASLESREPGYDALPPAAAKGRGRKLPKRLPLGALQLLVPAYFYPAGPGLLHWERLFQASRSAEVIAIVNPSSGPGEKSDPNYVDIVKRADASGLRTLGYLSTSYAKRPLAEVQADVDKWFQLYSEVQGVFLDEQTSTIDGVDYYVALSRYIRQKRPEALIFTNPGTVCAREYLTRAAADVVCIAERGKDFGAEFPAWVKEESPGRFAALIYEIDQPEQMRQLIREGIARRIGYIFVTDTRLPNPWDRLPSWWNAEVDAVRELNPPQRN